MSEWISVEDRLPDDDVDVLVWDGTGHGVGYRVDTTWFELLPWTKSATHWMLLPKPPLL